MASPDVFLDIVPYQTAFKWRNDPSIYRWCRQATTISEHKHNNYWEMMENTDNAQFYGVYRLKNINSVEPIGVAGLTSISYISRTAEFSLYIAPKFQRKGHAKDALIELCSRGFHELGLNRIWGETFENNHAFEFFKKLGMKKEGTLRDAYFKDGKYWDTHVVSILRREWDELYSTAYLRHVLHNASRSALHYHHDIP